VVNMPVGGPAVMNNYMIAQPPGFQLAAFVSVHSLTLILSLCMCLMHRKGHIYEFVQTVM
jgi:hypothetical protein